MKLHCAEGSKCWEWLHARQNGYGRLPSGNYAHRSAYALWKGKLKRGMEIDHLCRNPLCFNPEHLEQVTHRENVRRGLAGNLKTHCINGHTRALENVWKDSRSNLICWICKKETELKTGPKYRNSAKGRRTLKRRLDVLRQTEEFKARHRQYQQLYLLRKCGAAI